MIRKLLFILFLYVLLVWIIAGIQLRDDPTRLINVGLLWTAVGVASLLLWLILERLIGWWRVRRAQNAARPVTPVAASKPMNEDIVALLNLLREADQRLAQAPGALAVRPARALDLPLYLMVGPEGAGKTAVLYNSGIEPALLAGQVLGGGAAVTSTRVANLWLAQQSLFLEVSGRIFNGEPGRLTDFLRVLQPGSSAAGWRSWFRPTQRPIALRGVVLVFDSRRFGGTPELSELDRAAQAIRERMLAIAEVLGAEFPVYVLFTRTDALPYFTEFFARLGEAEAGQVFGVLNTAKPGVQTQDRVWAEAETKRLNRQFQSLIVRLSDRRLLGLTQETEAGRKPAIYEFPREFKRIRTPLVQFLVDVFKPDPLKAGPLLRGFFFTATRKAERAAVPESDTQRQYRSSGGGFEVTQMFSPEMLTSIGDPMSAFRKVAPKSGSGQLVDVWMFVTEFFHKVLSLDRPAVRRVAAPSKLEQHRKIVVGATACLTLLLALVWTISWIGNRQLEGDVWRAVREARMGSGALSSPNLQALDRLRGQLLDLDRNDSWSLHWGLYTGGALRDEARRVYFERLKLLSLDTINRTLASQMQQDSQAGGVSTSDRLKAHRTITALGCPPDQTLISRVLRETAMEAHPNLEDEQRRLLNEQLGFYSTQVVKNKPLPVELPEDPAAENRARTILNAASGGDQQLNSFLAGLRGSIKTLVVADQVKDYQKVLIGQAEISGEFTPEGMKAFEDWVKTASFDGVPDCGTGKLAGAVSMVENSETRERVKSHYYQRYAKAWREFLGSYKVIGYSGYDDAAKKLGILSDATSPLVGIVKLVAVNTNYPPPKVGGKGVVDKVAEGIGLGSAVQKGKKAEKDIEQTRQHLAGDAPPMVKADFARLFQPVSFTVPPESDVLVNDHNTKYVEGLRALQRSLEALSQASTAERTELIPPARTALQQARDSRIALADKFENVGNEGLNKTLTDLLEQPIGFADSVIPKNTEISLIQQKNGDLKQLCQAMSRILVKYPFTASNSSEATLSDIAAAFGPTDGFVSKYAQKSVDLVVRPNKKEWDPNPALQNGKVTPELLSFLNRAQQFTDAFFVEGGSPKLKYVLRPVAGQTIVVRFTLDGTELSSENALQKTFYWPSSAGAKPGADGTVEAGGFSTGFGHFDGLWGVFRLFLNADERPFRTKIVQWSKIRGLGGAATQQLNPPAKVEIVEFPGEVDVFNPKFFDGLKCPPKAVVQN